MYLNRGSSYFPRTSMLYTRIFVSFCYSCTRDQPSDLFNWYIKTNYNYYCKIKMIKKKKNDGNSEYRWSWGNLGSQGEECNLRTTVRILLLLLSLIWSYCCFLDEAFSLLFYCDPQQQQKPKWTAHVTTEENNDIVKMTFHTTLNKILRS